MTAKKIQIQKLSIVLPCYNEELAIDPVIGELLSVKQKLMSRTGLQDVEIIVINDGSNDQSLTELEKYQDKIRVHSHRRRKGYGRALKTGFQLATGDVLAFYDMDDTCCPEDLAGMVTTMSKDDIGMVCGNRLNTESKMPLQRFIGNRLYMELTRLFLKADVADCCTGIRVFHRDYKDLFCRVLPDDLNFSLAMTIAYLRLGGKYHETPVRYKKRVGQSKLSVFTDGPLFLMTLIKFATSSKYSKSSLENLFPPSPRH